LRFVSFEFEDKRKIDHMIRENKDEDNDLSLFEFVIRICEYVVNSENRKVFESWLIQGL
jgi:hypothetical protein